MAEPVLRININQISSISDNNNNNNNDNIRSTTKKCLFGAADPVETCRLVEEQFAEERRRFFERFGIEMDNLENVAVDKSPRRRDRRKAPTERAPRRALRPYNVQTKMTDFCQIKKSSSLALHKKL